MPDIRLDEEVQRLQSNSINGTKHIPVAFAPRLRVGGTPPPALGRTEPRKKYQSAFICRPPSSPPTTSRRCGPATSWPTVSMSRTTSSTRAPLASLSHLLRARGRRPQLGARDTMARSDLPHLGFGHGHRASRPHHRRLHRPCRDYHRGPNGRHGRRPRTTGCASGSAWAGARRSSSRPGMTSPPAQANEMITDLEVSRAAGGPSSTATITTCPSARLSRRRPHPSPFSVAGTPRWRCAGRPRSATVGSGPGREQRGKVRPPRRPGSGTPGGRHPERAIRHLSRSTNGPTSMHAVSPRPAPATSCARPGCSSRSIPVLPDDTVLADRLVAVKRFAEEIVAKV